MSQIECLAAICSEPNGQVIVERILVDPPKEGEVRVKLEAASLCASDLHVIEGSGLKVPVKFPTVLGHEGAGVIESVGPDITGLSPGDGVLLFGLPQCGQCRLCRGGRSNLCSKFYPLTQFVKPVDGETRFHRLKDASPIYFSFGLSAFSQYTVVIKDQVVKVSDDLASKISAEQLAMLGCGIPTGYGSALNIAKVAEGSQVAIWGLGAVGLSTIHGCSQAGARRIIAIDINEKRFEAARSFGATECINATKYTSQDLSSHLIKETDGGLDYAFDCTGDVEAVQIALDSLWTNGTLVVVGAAGPQDAVRLSTMGPLFGKTITGGIYGLYKRSDVRELVERVVDGRLSVDKFITHRVKLGSINDGINALKEGIAIKVVIQFE